MAKNTICLWFETDAEAAARFYVETFPDSKLHAVHRAPGDYPGGKQDNVITVDFTVASAWANALKSCSPMRESAASSIRRAFSG